MIPDTMWAGISSPQGIRLGKYPVPSPGRDEVLVRVRAAGMNRADLNAARGGGVAAGLGTGKPIGMEWAGEVVALGDGATDLAPGDLVTCSGSGGYAEFAVAKVDRCIRFDSGQLPVTDAAVLPMALMTAANALFDIGDISESDTVLVQGATSAVGLAALQLAKRATKGRVIGAARNRASLAKLAPFGADDAVCIEDPDWADCVLAATEGRGADIVIDMVTGRYLNDTMRATAVAGRIVAIGRLGGVRTDFDLDLHALRRLAFVGVTFRTRTDAQIADIVRTVRERAWANVMDAGLRLPVCRQFALADCAEAHQFMADNRHFGKIALLPNP